MIPCISTYSPTLIVQFFGSTVEKSKKRKLDDQERNTTDIIDSNTNAGYVIDESGALIVDDEGDLDVHMEDDRAQWEEDARDQEIPGFPDRWATAAADGSKYEAGPPNSDVIASPRKDGDTVTDLKPASPSSSRPISISKPDSKTTSPKSKSSKGKKPATGEWHTCPICWKEFNVDNAGLNAHVDYCLSKGTIMEATTSTSEDHDDDGDDHDDEDDGEQLKAKGVALGTMRKRKKRRKNAGRSDAGYDTPAAARTKLSLFGKPPGRE